jgi:hypothetical protein
MAVSGHLLVLLDRTGLGAVGRKNIGPTDLVGVEILLMYNFKTEFSLILEKFWKTMKLIK